MQIGFLRQLYAFSFRLLCGGLSMAMGIVNVLAGSA